MSNKATTINLDEVRKQRASEAYKRLVLQVFSDMEHADRREQLQRRADVERANREKL